MSWNVAQRMLGIGLASLIVSLCHAQSLRDCADARGILIGAAARPSNVLGADLLVYPGARVQHDRTGRRNEVVGAAARPGNF